MLTQQSRIGNRKYSVMLLIVSLLASCGGTQKNTFHQAESSKAKPSPAASEPASTAKNASSSNSVPGTNDSSSVDISANSEAKALEKEFFSYSGKANIVDFLFVIDNSCSMNDHLDKVKAGFRAVPTTKFPTGARLGVMTTMPADPNDLSKVHPAVIPYNGINVEPGFLSLVDSASVAKFKKLKIEQADSYPQEVCASPWFAPSDKNTKSESCLDAALQIVGFCVGAEAGLTSFAQLMKKNANKPLFREGAYVHIIFVSDAHDPGIASQSLKNLRPDFAAIERAVKENSKVTGVKLHGIVPSTECGETLKKDPQFAFTGFSYIPQIQASNGVLLNLCTATDYSPVANQIIESSTPDAIFYLRKATKTINKVTVNGTETKNFTLESGTKIILPGLDPAKHFEVAVSYEP